MRCWAAQTLARESSTFWLEDSTGPTSAPQSQRIAPSSNPVAKYIEVTGFRINEKGPGKLQIRFAVVNHSDADIGNLQMTVNLRTTAAKPEDPPLATFTTRVEGLGPAELKEAHAEVSTKLRAYELPDWQFLTSDFTVADSAK